MLPTFILHVFYMLIIDTLEIPNDSELSKWYVWSLSVSSVYPLANYKFLENGSIHSYFHIKK